MCRKLVCLASIALVFGVVSSASAELVGYWRFDEGSGTTAADSSGNGGDGTFQGSPQWVPGRSGSALEFDGDDWVDCGDILDIAGPITIACWVNPAGLTDDNGWVARWDVYAFKSSGTSLRFTTPGILDYTANNTTLQIGEWQHVAVTFVPNQTGGAIFYLDGVEAQRINSTGMTAGGTQFGIGNNRWSQFYEGMIDDVRVYDTILTEVEIQAAMQGGKGFPFALGPNPADGGLHEATWVSLSWRPGDFAVSHDVYLGDNFDDVNNGAADTFRGNQGATNFIAGFVGFPYPDGLVPGTTYYWRIDEVNDADPNSPWKGSVWSFMVPPKKAYNPVPADGARFVAPAPTLSWTGGFGAKLHTVYFGDDPDAIANAAGGMAQAAKTFTPAGPLEPGKVYYWRVDELDPPNTHKGDVWSFEVAEEGGGIKGEYFRGMDFNTLALTRTDPQIDFNWGDTEPDPAVGADGFSVRWTGQVEAVFTETYTLYTNSDDGVRLWVDGKRLVNNWTDHGNTEDRGKIDLVAGQTYSVVMEMYENTGGAVAQLRWESSRTPKELIPAAALSFLVNAYGPSPANGTVGVKLQSPLTWKPGEFAASHEVYFGTDADAVANATKASPEYKGNKQLGDESLDPGMLAFDTTYYWRVDEIDNTNPDSPWVGNVWSFSTGPFLLVDGFESYNDIDPPDTASDRIFDKWIDGFGTTTNGALVGNDLPPYAEQTVVHSGAQSMIYRYDNAGKTSEATLTLVWPRDFTAEGVTKLSLWVRGSSTNAADRIFVALNGTAVVYHDNPAATQIAGWNEWVIDLATFGVNLANVNTITIGFGTKGSPAAGGAGQMYFDDIRLYR